MRHLLPPPPLPAGASPWEAVVVAEMRPAVRSLVRSVRGLEKAAWTEDDAVQRLLVEIVLACRQWARKHGPGRPAERYVWAAIHRARRKLYRGVARGGKKLAARTGEYDDDEAVVVAVCPAPRPDEDLDRRERQAIYVEVTAGLFSLFSEEDTELLRLAAEGLAPREIAVQVGRPGDNVAVSQRLYVLRRRAREHLAGLGIDSLSALHHRTRDALDACAP